MEKIKNKCGILLLVSLLAIFLMPLGVSAQDAVIGEELPNAGITPDSALWEIDVFFDGLRYRFAANVQDRVRIGLEIAHERLSEMNQMNLQNQVQYMEKARLKHSERINQLYIDIEAMVGDTTGIELGMQNHIKAMEQVRERIRTNENISRETRNELANQFQNQITRAKGVKTNGKE